MYSLVEAPVAVVKLKSVEQPQSSHSYSLWQTEITDRSWIITIAILYSSISVLNVCPTSEDRCVSGWMMYMQSCRGMLLSHADQGMYCKTRAILSASACLPIR